MCFLNVSSGYPLASVTPKFLNPHSNSSLGLKRPCPGIVDERMIVKLAHIHCFVWIFFQLGNVFMICLPALPPSSRIRECVGCILRRTLIFLKGARICLP